MSPAKVLKKTAATVGISDADLVRRVRQGDAWAEDALCRRYLSVVAGTVARLLGSRHDVDDVVQDAFLAAFSQIDRLREPAAFRLWLMRIAVTGVRRTIRRRRLQRRLGLLYSPEDATLEALVDEGASPETRAELAAIDAVLRRMPVDERLAWMLRHVEGHDLKTVAAECGCSLATVKRRIDAARETLRAVTRMEDADE